MKKKKNIITSSVLCFLLLIAGTYCLYYFSNTSNPGNAETIGDIPTSRVTQTRGIDVSHYQKNIDWEKVAADNVQFEYIKATEGATYQDPMFKKNIAGAHKAGLLVGVYHYFRMTSTPEEQFENFKKTVKNYKIDLIPMINVETDDRKGVKELQKNLDKFIALIKAEYGVSPMIYGTQRSYNTYCAPQYNK